MTNISDQVRENIKRAREYRGISPEQMATHLDIAARTYLDFESGKTKMELERLQKVAEKLEMSTEQLMTLHEHNTFNTLNNKIGQCFMATTNTNVYVLDREVYEQHIADLRREADLWRSEYAQLKEERAKDRQQIAELLREVERLRVGQ